MIKFINDSLIKFSAGKITTSTTLSHTMEKSMEGDQRNELNLLIWALIAAVRENTQTLLDLTERAKSQNPGSDDLMAQALEILPKLAAAFGGNGLPGLEPIVLSDSPPKTGIEEST